MTLDCEKTMCEAVKRAKVYRFFNYFTSTVYFISYNHEAPLTTDEMTMIKHWLNARFPNLKVVFTTSKEDV